MKQKTNPTYTPITTTHSERTKMDNKEKIPGGYYIKARKIRDSQIAHCAPVVREIWDYLLRECNHTDNPKSGIKRGQIFTSYPDMMEALHWYVGYRKNTYSKTQCERATKVLTNMDMITTTKTTRGLIITICNYETYANPKNYEDNNEDFTKDLRRSFGDNTIQDNVENNENKNIGTNVPVKTDVLPLVNDAELKSLYRSVDVTKVQEVTKFIKEYKPLFAEPYCILWNLFAVKYGFAQVQKLTGTRRKKLRTRLSDKDFNFPSILGKAKDAEGLRSGQWFTFDWLIANENNYVKLMEGKYDKAMGNASASVPNTEISAATLEMLKGQ